AAGTDTTPARQYGPFPLVLFSQGFDEDPSGYDLLLGQWAAAGFVVAAPTYPHTDPGPGLDRSDIVHHPAELSAAVSQVLAEAAQPGTVMSGLVNPTAIAAAGQSDGGDVTLAAAANSCCRDTRLKAALILSGAEYDVFGGSYYSTGSPPLLVTQGSADSAAQGNAPICSVQLYNGAPAPKYYLDLIGAGHLPPYTQPDVWEPVVRAVTVDFLDAYLKGSSGAAAMAGDGTAAGVASLTTAPALPVPGGVCTG
ncbi:MAG TPA: hypothetical protein VE991_10250, partial [Acidimicrobiales bacterium]|nr:hypothetical protein [Acidimicrobiales bacterium]